MQQQIEEYDDFFFLFTGEKCLYKLFFLEEIKMHGS